jgi:probable DNA repair protein
VEGLLALVESCQAAGGTVLAASERAARALAAEVHRARQRSGLRAWPAPAILTFSAFVRQQWERRCPDARLVLNALQEEALWDQVAAQELSLATALAASRQRLGALAMEAHRLLALYAPAALNPRLRRGWTDDAAVFSRWLEAFDRLCEQDRLLPAARLILELAAALERDPRPRPPLLLAGFDRLAPSEQALLEAWGTWRQLPLPAPAAEPYYHLAADPRAELEACAAWCAQTLAAAPSARLMLLTQEAAARRGQIERALLAASRRAGQPLAFEFSLGVSLASLPWVRAAMALLNWLTGPIEEPDLDWLVASGLAAAGEEEARGLRAHVQALRARGLQRTGWTLEAFLHTQAGSSRPPEPWRDRLASARQLLQEHSRRAQSPLAWCELVPRLLDQLAFAQSGALASAEFQALDSLRQLTESCGSLGFDGRQVGFREFLTSLRQAAAAALFAPESSGASVLITGPAESAGLSADALWFLGVEENSWPAQGRPHPLLPLLLQRQAAMPHATPQLDHELAQRQTARLLASAPQAHFSLSRQNESGELRPSRLLVDLAGAPRPLESTLAGQSEPQTLEEIDRSRIPFAPGPVRGGAAVLSHQSQCPFRAFARARLGLRSYDPAQPCLTPAQRGNLVHAVLHSVWAGPPEGIQTHAELAAIADLADFTAPHVGRVFSAALPAGLRQALPARYLELEQERLTGLVAEWLAYESTRVAFEVAATEQKRTVSIAGLVLDLRLDRLDRLNDGTFLVVDYKTGPVSASDWDPPRPRDVQLPLYAGFALERESEPVGGLVFAQIVAGGKAFQGRVGQARSTLLPDLHPRSALVGDPLTLERMDDWRRQIEALARAFLAGEAVVDPARFPKTCEHCGLEVLCRVRELEPAGASEDEEPEVADA